MNFCFEYESNMEKIKLQPIGIVHSPFKTQKGKRAGDRFET